MATGIAVSDKCLDAYRALSKREYGTVIIKLNEEHTEFVIDKCLPPTAGNPEAEWKTLIETIPKDNCRFIITDFSWKETPTVVKSKIIQIIWSPDSSPIFSKMLYASSQEAISSNMSAQKSVQATDLDEIDYPTIKRGISK